MPTLKVVDENSQYRQGLILMGGEVFHTLERGWNDNAPFLSCVPRGIYDLVPFESVKYGDCFVMVNEDLNVFERKDSPGRPVNGRYKCLFAHRGNYPRNFVGCIGAGFNWVEDKTMITNTLTTCKRLMELVSREDDLRLEIV